MKPTMTSPLDPIDLIDPIAQWLARRPHLILDGALATDIQGGIRMVAEFIVEMRAAMNTLNYPQMQQELDVQTLQNVRTVLGNN